MMSQAVPLFAEDFSCISKEAAILISHKLQNVFLLERHPFAHKFVLNLKSNWNSHEYSWLIKSNWVMVHQMPMVQIHSHSKLKIRKSSLLHNSWLIADSWENRTRPYNRLDQVDNEKNQKLWKKTTCFMKTISNSDAIARSWNNSSEGTHHCFHNLVETGSSSKEIANGQGSWKCPQTCLDIVQIAGYQLLQHDLSGFR